jgi:hypothetical protein
VITQARVRIVSGSRSRTGVLTEWTHHRARWPWEQGGANEDGCDCFDALTGRGVVTLGDYTSEGEDKQEDEDEKSSTHCGDAAMRRRAWWSAGGQGRKEESEVFCCRIIALADHASKVC